MPSHKGAAVESQGKVLLAALGERVGGDRVRVTTEDGRAFDYPEARILWTARRLRAEGGSKREVAAALAVLRAGAGPAPDWEALRGAVPTGVPLDPTDAVRAGADEAGNRGALALAARAHEGAPHFRIDKGRLVAATEAEVAAARERADAERRAREAGEALAEALKSGSRAALPPEAAPALEPLLEWAPGPGGAGAPPIRGGLGVAEGYEGRERLHA